MSSKQQFREALKGDKKIIADLKQQIAEKDHTIKALQNNVNFQKTVIVELTKRFSKRWWQFWK